MNKVTLKVEIEEDYLESIKASTNKTSSDIILINATPIIECDGAISRDMVIKAVDAHTNEDGTLDDDISIILEDLPSVTPEREQGEWCEQNDDYFNWYECSECGYGSEGEMQYSSEHDVRTKYCPNCGAEMR